MTEFVQSSKIFELEPHRSKQGERLMNKTFKLAIAGLVAALATTVGMAAPADAKAPTTSLRVVDCC